MSQCLAVVGNSQGDGRPPAVSRRAFGACLIFEKHPSIWLWPCGQTSI